MEGIAGAVSGMAAGAVGAKIQTAVQKKAMDVLETQGEMLMELVDAGRTDGGGFDVRM